MRIFTPIQHMTIYEYPPHSRTLLTYDCNGRKSRQFVKLCYTQFIFIYDRAYIDVISTMAFKMSLTPLELFHDFSMVGFVNAIGYPISGGCLGEWNTTDNPLDWITRFWQTDFWQGDINCYLQDMKNANH